MDGATLALGVLALTGLGVGAYALSEKNAADLKAQLATSQAQQSQQQTYQLQMQQAQYQQQQQGAQQPAQRAGNAATDIFNGVAGIISLFGH